MDTNTSEELRNAVAQIVREDELPPDLLTQVREALTGHRDADDLYRWTMQLTPHIESPGVQRIGYLVQDAVTILNESDLDQGAATTLPGETRAKLRTLRENTTELSGPATYILGFDVLNRAYNRSRSPEAST